MSKKLKYFIFFIICVLILFFVSVINNRSTRDNLYTKDLEQVESLQFDGINELFIKRISQLFPDSSITTWSLILKGFSKNLHKNDNMYSGSSTYIVSINNTEREFFISWKKESNKDIVILSIEEINDSQSTSIYSYSP